MFQQPEQAVLLLELKLTQVIFPDSILNSSEEKREKYNELPHSPICWWPLPAYCGFLSYATYLQMVSQELWIDNNEEIHGLFCQMNNWPQLSGII